MLSVLFRLKPLRPQLVQSGTLNTVLKLTSAQWVEEFYSMLSCVDGSVAGRSRSRCLTECIRLYSSVPFWQFFSSTRAFSAVYLGYDEQLRGNLEMAHSWFNEVQIITCGSLIGRISLYLFWGARGGWQKLASAFLNGKVTLCFPHNINRVRQFLP